MSRIYACIDLKSFYASVECRERKLDPLKTNLVVADKERTQKTICLAVSPSLKEYGIKGRPRLFEVNQIVNKINKTKSSNKKTYNSDILKQNPNIKLDFIIAKPRMSLYIKCSTEIYNTYLKYISKDDIFVYSIDEVFCDITDYLHYYNLTPKQLVTKMVQDVYIKTGVTATAGIGTNMYLCKVAMDILAKHEKPNKEGVRIAALDEMTYRKLLWSHQPLTDFWRVGVGYKNKLEKLGIKTMGDIARCSIENEELLYKLFGVNAELLIDHAWGYEPCTMEDVKKYKSLNSSISSGQVLNKPYNYEKGKLIIREMADELSLNLSIKKQATDKITLTIGYDINNDYDGEMITDYYHRKLPKPAHGTINLEYKTSSSKIIEENALKLYEKIINKNLNIKRINITASNLSDVDKVVKQLDIFSLNENFKEKEEKNDNEIQNVIINLKEKYGKNSIIKVADLSESATTIQRNNQIGGHNA